MSDTETAHRKVPVEVVFEFGTEIYYECSCGNPWPCDLGGSS
jgi:hypothetical protein